MTAFIDNVAGNVTSPGTADFTGFSATGQHDAWSTVANGTVVAYRAEYEDGTAGYETGEGTYSAGTLTRTTVKTSTNGAGTKYDFNSGVVRVSLGADSDELGNRLEPANDLSDLNDAATARTNLGVDAAGTDNSTPVTLAGEDYLSITGQQVTANAIDLDNLSATGTADSSTFLRGDNTWATPAGGGSVESVNSIGPDSNGNISLSADDISDVAITTPADNEVLAYDSGSGNWINQTPAEASLQGVLAEGAFVDGDKTKLDGIETGADVTDTANVTSAGALMDSEVDADLKTLSLPANTTISVFGASLTDDVDAATARATLDVDQAGTDNSTPVTLAGQDYLALAGQQITANPLDLDDLSATGTPDATTFLRGDNTWAVPAGGGSVESVNSIGPDSNGNIVLSVDDISDVVITAPADNEVLAYDSGGNWINQTAAEAGLASSSHTHTLTDITDSGALAALDTVGTSQIDDDAVSNAKLANMDTARLKGRTTAGTGDPEDLTAAQARTLLNVEDGADVTDTANVTAAGALMDSEVDADLKTLSLPANTTISAFGASLVDDADAATARTTLDVDQAGTDNSTPVTLAGQDYLSLAGQQVTANQIEMDDISATGTADSSTFLRGDGAWATPAGSGTVQSVNTQGPDSNGDVTVNILVEDLDCQLNEVNGVGRIDFNGTAATHTSSPGAFINNSRNHTWDYLGGPFSLGRFIEAGYQFAGTHTITGGNANSAAMGSLFVANAVIKNNSTQANNLGSFIAFSMTTTFRADTQTISLPNQRSFNCAPLYVESSGGSLTVTREENYYAKPVVSDTSTLSKSVGYSDDGVDVAAGATCTTRIGFASKISDTDVANSTAFAIGYNSTDTLPSGDWAIYQGNGDERPCKWNGGHELKVATVSGTSYSTDETDHIIKCTNTSGTGTCTVSLHSASGHNQELFIKRYGTGTVVIDPSGSENSDGSSSSRTLATQYHLLHIVSDGTEWMIMHNGAP